MHKALDLVENDVYYEIGGVDPYYLDEHCFHSNFRIVEVKEGEKTLGRHFLDGEEERIKYDLWHCLSSSHHVELCNASGIIPISGPNILPNSPPNHCLKYLSDEELAMRRKQVILERSIIKNLNVCFWLHQSMWQRSEYERLGLQDISICRQASNGVDTGLFKPFEEYGEQIIWSGRKWWPKGWWIFEKIAKAMPEQEFKVFSDDALGFTLPNVHTTVGLQHYQVAPKLNAAVHLCTSVSENQPLAILESLSCGVPVVAPAVSGIPEIIEDGKNGILIKDVENVEEYKKAIEYLSEDESERRRMGREGRKLIEKKFSLRCMGETLKKIYEEALEQ